MNEEVKLTPEQKEKLISRAENKIIDMLLGTYNNRMSDGYYGWHVQSFTSFIWQFANLNELERDFIDQAVESLLKKKHINVCDGPEREHIFIELTKQYFADQI